MGKTYHRADRWSGAFSRLVMLPCPVNEPAVDAQYRNGILTVLLLKAQEAKPKRITVKI